MTSTPQPPLAYRLHGHPVCLACLDDDYLLDDDDTARGWPARGDVPGVQPIHAGDPDAADLCAGCRRPLTTLPATDARDLDHLDHLDDAPFRPDDGPARLALAAARLQDAAAALHRCLAHGDLAGDPHRDAFQDLAARLAAAPDPCTPHSHAPAPTDPLPRPTLTPRQKGEPHALDHYQIA